MRRDFSSLLASGLLLAAAASCQAQDHVVVGEHSIPVVQGYNHIPQRGCSWQQIWDWMTYRPLPMPKCCKCCRVNPTATPPLYMYFLGEYGPRSPLLGYAGPHDGFAGHGTIPADAHGDFVPLGTGPIPEHGLPVSTSAAPMGDTLMPVKGTEMSIHSAPSGSGSTVPLRDLLAFPDSAVAAPEAATPPTEAAIPIHPSPMPMPASNRPGSLPAGPAHDGVVPIRDVPTRP
jgi:hypothetical protein